MKARLFLLAFVITTSCAERDVKSSEDEKAYVPPTRTLNNEEISERLLNFDTLDVSEAERIADDMFGSFFCDRALFYVIENPTNDIHSSRASSVTLCYLDRKLMQTKYIVESDIHSSLINRYGKFKIHGLDERNKQILKDEKVVVKSGGTWTLNPNLDNYEIRWTLDKKEIKYRVSLTGDRYSYVERVSGYDKQFKFVEHNCL